MKVFQILHDKLHWETAFHSINETVGKYPPDVEFVETPDYVSANWSFDRIKEGDARFSPPAAPEGWAYDPETNTFYNLDDVPVQLEQAKNSKQNENKMKLNEFLSANPLKYTDGKDYGVTFEDQQEIALNITQYQIQSTAGIANPRLEWHASKEPCITWTIEELTMLTIAISEHVYPYFNQMQEYKAEIYECTDKKMVEAIDIKYVNPTPPTGPGPVEETISDPEVGPVL